MCNAIKLYMNQFRAYLIAACAVALFATGWIIAWKIQGGKIAKLEAEIYACREANISNENAITKMSRDREAAEQSCQKRLDRQRKTADKLREIDNYGGSQNEDRTGSDPVLNALDGMFMVLPETDR